MKIDTITITFILVNAAYLMTFTALSIKEVLWLRVVLACSHSMIFINNYYYAQNYNVAIWNFIFIIVNIIQVIRIYDDRKPRMIPNDMEDLYRNLFKSFTSKEFLYLMNLGERETISNQKIISLGQQQKDLLLVLNGQASVMRDSIQIANLSRGQFVGEISFITEQPASADVYAKEELECIKWDQNKIRAIKISNNAFWAKLNAVLTNDLTSKITS
tara:strand:+ start:216 stop:863 length:648 start_codon:yes stop_codon:yes gene_type:complete